MPRSTYGYDSYHGRSGLRNVLTALIIILLVLLILAVAAFFLLQKYMVYTDDGQAHLELPFFQRTEETAAPSIPVESQDVIIVIPTDTPEPTPTPEPVVNLLWLPRTSLTDGSAAQLVEDAGADAALLDLKAEDGTLGYVSDAPLAILYGASGYDRRLNTAITELTATDLYTVARLSCFKDHIVPYNYPGLAIRMPNGYNWRDADNRRWLNVAIPEARNYVTAVVKELAAMGFDEILLDYSAFPTAGDLSLIRPETYPDGDRSVTVEQFYSEVAAALEGTGVKLSLSATRELLLGEDDQSGQTPELLGKYAYRLYVPQSEAGDDYTAFLDAAGLTGDRLVYLVPNGAAASGTVSQLILPQ